MNVLIACEESQEVCKAFRAKGHQAFSCDILDCSGGHPEWHIKENVLNIFDEYMVRGFEGDRARHRSKTFTGIAKAMADQWG